MQLHLPVKRGVPQDSILGPVLFILVTSPEYSQVRPIMKADNTAMLVAKQNFITLGLFSLQYLLLKGDPKNAA